MKSLSIIILFCLIAFFASQTIAGMFENCSSGKIKVTLRSSLNGMPLAGALVRITSFTQSGNKVGLIGPHSGRTDKDGVVILKTVGYVRSGPDDMSGTDWFALKATLPGFKDTSINGKFTSCEPGEF